MCCSEVFPVFSFVLLFAYCTAISVSHLPKKGDAAAGELRKDIPEINAAAGLNFFEGDIVTPKKRNAIRGDQNRWKFPIPFILADNLALNAKGVILKVFEGFRLKSCVDFKAHEEETSFIIFQDLGGCWSGIGDSKTGQTISIGEGCDEKGIVLHEVLHSLGFYHEQTRTDRDDYVKIWWDHVTPGQERNFIKYNEDFLTDLNTRYDYESVMHYGPRSFAKNQSLMTITANIPEFNQVIGQRIDFSILDLERLYRMYNCTQPLTLLDECPFESANLCGHVQEVMDNDDWIHKKSNSEGDRTGTGQCTGTGYSMYFDTSFGKADESAVLKSRILSSKRMQQCLEFYVKMTGSSLDKLIIWIQINDGFENILEMIKAATFQGDADKNWKIAYVPVRGGEKFRYHFHGIKGNPYDSSGGIYIDDVSLSDTQCPSAVWNIHNFFHLLETKSSETVISPRFYSPEGYAFSVMLITRDPNDPALGDHINIYFHLVSGDNDDVLEWPVLNRQVTITVLDQDPDVRRRMSMQKSFTTDVTHILKDKTTNRWVNPSVFGEFDPLCNCKKSFNWGWKNFLSHAQLRRRQYLKNGNLIILVDFEDITHLKKMEHSLPQIWPIHEDYALGRKKRSDSREEWPSYLAELCHPSHCQNNGSCVKVKGNASCRCASSKIFVYMGDRCQTAHFHRTILGLLVGGAAGIIVLTIIIASMLAKRKKFILLEQA